MSRSLWRNSAWQLLQTGFGSGAELALMLSLAATRPPEEFGRIAVALSATKILYLLFEARIHEFLTPQLMRYLPRQRAGAWIWLRWGVRLEAKLNLAAFATCMFAAAVLPLWLTDIPSSMFVVAATYNGANTLMKFSSLGTLRCLNRVREASLIAMLSAGMKVALLGLGVFFHWTLQWLFALLSLAAAAASCMQARRAFVELERLRGRPATPVAARRGRLRRNHARLLLSNYANGLVEVVHRELDVQLAAWLAGTAAAGQYRLAKTLAMTMLEALNPIVLVLLPEMSRRLHADTAEAMGRFLRRISLMLGGVGVGAGVAVLAASWIYLHLVAAKQQSAWVPVMILVGGFIAMSPGLWAQSYLVAASRSQWYLKASGSGACAAVIGALLLVPKWGATGSSLAFVAGLVLATALALSFTRSVRVTHRAS